MKSMAKRLIEHLDKINEGDYYSRVKLHFTREELENLLDSLVSQRDKETLGRREGRKYLKKVQYKSNVPLHPRLGYMNGDSYEETINLGGLNPDDVLKEGVNILLNLGIEDDQNNPVSIGSILKSNNNDKMEAIKFICSIIKSATAYSNKRSSFYSDMYMKIKEKLKRMDSKNLNEITFGVEYYNNIHGTDPRVKKDQRNIWDPWRYFHKEN